MGKASGDLTGVAAAEPVVHKLPRPSAATTASASVLPMLLLPKTCLEQCPALQKVARQLGSTAPLAPEAAADTGNRACRCSHFLWRAMLRQGVVAE
jgi:hypothetical protein